MFFCRKMNAIFFQRLYTKTQCCKVNMAGKGQGRSTGNKRAKKGKK